MEFGKIEDISNVNWSIPLDDPKNERLQDQALNPQVYFGSPAWSNKF
jgi:hypothetical protein